MVVGLKEIVMFRFLNLLRENRKNGLYRSCRHTITRMRGFIVATSPQRENRVCEASLPEVHTSGVVASWALGNDLLQWNAQDPKLDYLVSVSCFGSNGKEEGGCNVPGRT